MWHNYTHPTGVLIVGLIGLLLLASCNIPGGGQLPVITPTGLISDTGSSTSTSILPSSVPAAATTVAVPATAIITDTPSAAPVVTDTPMVGTPADASGSGQPGQCAYMWAEKNLPDVSVQVNQALTQAGFTDAQARVSAFGENCFNSESNKAVSFSAMQTDFHLTVPVKDINDTQALGDWVARILSILAKFPPGQVPGPNLGYAGFQFKDGTQEQNLWFPLKKGQDLLQQGTTGSALFQALKTQ